MAKIQKHIQIARTETKRQSSMGLKSCLMIRDVLSRHYERVEITNVSSVTDLQTIVGYQPDLVFLGLKRTSPSVIASNYTPSDDVWVSAYLDENAVNFTGSQQAAIMLDLHKNHAKHAVKAAGLPTASYFMAYPGQYLNVAALPIQFPLFLKPPTQGGGKGIGADSIVRNFGAYQAKVASIKRLFGTDSLVETYLDGREFSVALMGNGSELIAMPVELIANQNEQGDRILGSKVKAADTEEVIAVGDKDVRDRLITKAKAVFVELGGRDYGRIDFRMDTQGTIYFLEANLVPGLANNDFISYFTHACMLNEDMAYEAMILRIVEISLSRTEPGA